MTTCPDTGIPSSPQTTPTPSTLTPQLVDQFVDEARPGGRSNPYDDPWSEENYIVLAARVEAHVIQSLDKLAARAGELTALQLAQLEHLGMAWMSGTGRKLLEQWLNEQPHAADVEPERRISPLEKSDLMQYAVFVPDWECRMNAHGITEGVALRSEITDLRRVLSVFFPFLQSVTAMQAHVELGSLLHRATAMDQDRCNNLADHILLNLSRFSPVHATVAAERQSLTKLSTECADLRAKVESLTSTATGELTDLRAALAAGAGRALAPSDCIRMFAEAGITCTPEQALKVGRSIESHVRPTQRVITMAEHHRTLDSTVADYLKMERQRDELLEQRATIPLSVASIHTAAADKDSQQ